MFCFQCEQTAKGQGCTTVGVCGKKPDTADLQDELVSALVELALYGEKNEENTNLIIDGLFTTVTNVSYDNAVIGKLAEKVRSKINGENCFNIKKLWSSNEDIRSLKSLALFGLKGMAAYAHHARVLGYEDKTVNNFFFEALQSIATMTDEDELVQLVLKVGEINFKCIELLDRANTETYGVPTPTKVSTNIEPKPFIIISGHDLRDLALLLEQTKDKGVNVYTHGEMLPCHAYPELKKYPHLKGHFGTAWQNQHVEFDNVPAAILFTTNCIMPVKDSTKTGFSRLQ